MKRLYFKDKITAMTGVCSDKEVIYISQKNGKIGSYRKYVRPMMTTNNSLTGAKLRAAAKNWLSVNPEFAEEMNRYARAYNQQILPIDKRNVSGYNLFVSAVCKHAEPLDTLTELTDVLGNTINAFVSRKFLKKVSVNKPFTATISG